MRVLTKLEQQVFEDAFNCIGRVGVLHHSVDSIHEVKIAKDGTHLNLPSEIYSLVNSAGGLGKINNLFNDYKKEKTMKQFVDKCFKERIQPRDFIFDGLLIKKTIHHEEISYSERVA